MAEISPERWPREALKGLFISVEGGEGAGKSTIATTLAERLRARRYGVTLTREPGGTSRGEMIERIFEYVEKGNPLSPVAELFLFEADRAQHVWEEVIPELAADDIVICDRFTDSTLAYQGYGRGFRLDLIRQLNHWATWGLQPDATLLLDIPPEVGLAREGDQKDVTGRELLEFHERVRAGFIALAKEEPERFCVIDATLSEAEVAERAWAAVEKLLQSRASAR